MTEYLLHLGHNNTGDWASSDESIKWDESLTMLNTVHDAMTYNWNAYIWWYLQRFYSFIGDGEEGTPDGEIMKRGYAFSHYAKWVRPGFLRVEAKASQSNDLRISAYAGNNQIIAVIINPEDEDVTSLNLAPPSATAADAYVTSHSVNRQKRPAVLEGGKVIVDIPPKSVTTVVIQL